MRRCRLAILRSLGAAAVALTLLMSTTSAQAQACPCNRNIAADIVALDQAFFNNRLGAFQAGGMIFALRGDVVPNDGSNDLKPGKVMLRPDKRPRPMVLRMNVGDCLQVNFTNLLAPAPVVSNTVIPRNAQDPYDPNIPKFGGWNPDLSGGLESQPATREAGLHAMGMQLCSAGSQAGILSDGSWVGANSNSLVGPGDSATYKFYAGGEGAFLLYSTGATVGMQLDFGGQLMQGLFGSVTVQPTRAEWYRSQVTAEDLKQATIGTSELGQPLIDYHAVYQAGPLAGRPILKMLNDQNQIVHSDLTAIITGPKAGPFLPSDNQPPFNKNPAYPKRTEPYREMVIHYHDDFVAQQTFPAFEGKGQDANMEYTLQGGRDFFAINYGMAAIGPPIWANRIKVGPDYQCAACRYEEFFLSSWPLGDPAMIVDVPANATNPGGDPDKPVEGPKATKAFYPDDPSNVYHSYMGDHTQYRILHAGTNITHVHHQHAHQWLHSPNSPDGNYRDSQMITPGAAFTLDYVYHGSGNKNQTVGDSIFHCHFYPHFAQGMWALWRVHDTFEAGTELDKNGRPVSGPGTWSRALPDGEITLGTPTPAVVPMPSKPMAPMPARVKVCPTYDPQTAVQRVGPDCPTAPAPNEPPVGYMVVANADDIEANKNPGFPFYIPGIAGQRAPHPPLDFACVEDVEIVEENGLKLPRCKNGQYYDGGLPRHMVLEEVGTLYEKHNRWDFTKTNDKLVAIQLPEEGTVPEQIAMLANAQREHASSTPEGALGKFILNGQPPRQGAPYADPGINLDGKSILKDDGSNKLVYKAANIELDVVLNKKGWHYPQQRILALWGDVKDTLDGTRRPEPFFFRANSFDVVEYWHTNLMPNYYDLDDFQVRTPTDVLGQHIHLVKFDVTSSDGGANGFNYEDGTFSPQEVQEQIEAIDKNGGLFLPDASGQQALEAKTIPFFGEGPPNADDPSLPRQWVGAQATVQLWYADPLCNNTNATGSTPCAEDPGIPTEDRTIRTVFTHDHFSPSTHQQIGLYAGLVVEPFESKWFLVDGVTQMGDREAQPIGPNGQPTKDGGPTSWQALIQLPHEQDSYREFMIEFQDKQLAYTADSVSEKKPYVKYDCPTCTIPDPGGPWGWTDPTKAVRAPTPPDPSIFPGPPFPILVSTFFRTGTWSMNYNNEPLPFRVAGTGAGARFDLGDAFRSITRQDPALNVQPPAGQPINSANPAGFKFPPPQPGAGPEDPYTPLLRAYPGEHIQVRTLVGAHMAAHFFTMHGLNWLFEPANTNSGYRSTQGMGISEYYTFGFDAPRTVDPKRKATDYLYSPSSGTQGIENGNWGILRTYSEPQEDLPKLPSANPDQVPVCPQDAPTRSYRVAVVQAARALQAPVIYNDRGQAGDSEKTIWDWNALMYVLQNDLDANGKLKPNVPIEPLILRANAGDCIQITLNNRLPNEPLNTGTTLPAPYAGIQLDTSKQVGLHAQLITADVGTSDGVNVGVNPVQTAGIGKSVQYTWYAGNIEYADDSGFQHVPIEFGSVPLTPADPLMQHIFGLLGALIIEPQESTWQVDVNSRASALITKQGGESFREFVIILQDDVSSLKLGELKDQNGKLSPSPGDFEQSSWSQAINYRTEPLEFRYAAPNWLLSSITQALSNSQVLADPQTPVFAATAKQAVRMRLLHPAGLADQNLTLHGHVWQEEPYTNDSTEIGYNDLSQWLGTRVSFGPNTSFEVVLAKAGGQGEVPGDYLYRTFVGTDFQNGMWGIMRVGASNTDIVTVTEFTATTVAGVNTVNPNTGQMAKSVTVSIGGTDQQVPVDMMTGTWKFSGTGLLPPVRVTSALGGQTTAEAFTTGPMPPPAPPVARAAPPPRLMSQEEQFRFKPEARKVP